MKTPAWEPGQRTLTPVWPEEEVLPLHWRSSRLSTGPNSSCYRLQSLACRLANCTPYAIGVSDCSCAHQGADRLCNEWPVSQSRVLMTGATYSAAREPAPGTDDCLYLDQKVGQPALLIASEPPSGYWWWALLRPCEPPAGTYCHCDWPSWQLAGATLPLTVGATDVWRAAVRVMTAGRALRTACEPLLNALINGATGSPANRAVTSRSARRPAVRSSIEDTWTKWMGTRGDDELESDVTTANARRWQGGPQPGSTDWPQWPPQALPRQAAPQRLKQHGGQRTGDSDHCDSSDSQQAWLKLSRKQTSSSQRCDTSC